MRQLIRILSGSIAVTLLGVGLSACDSSEADPRLEPPLVRIATVKPAASSERAFTGVISARIQSNLGFRVGGKIIERLVDTIFNCPGRQARFRRIDGGAGSRLVAMQQSE